MPESAVESKAECGCKTSQDILLREAFPDYLSAASALHLVQSVAAEKLKNALDEEKESIKTACSLQEDPGAVVRSLYPGLPANNFNYQNAQICANQWLGAPRNADLYLYLVFEKKDEHVNSITLAVAFEVHQKNQRGALTDRLCSCEGFFSEQWDHSAVGLKRPLASADTIKEEAVALLKEFLGKIA
jgi:hypothetical protein